MQNVSNVRYVRYYDHIQDLMRSIIEIVDVKKLRHPVSGFRLLRPARLSFTVDISVILGLSEARIPRNANEARMSARWEGAGRRKSRDPHQSTGFRGRKIGKERWLLNKGISSMLVVDCTWTEYFFIHTEVVACSARNNQSPEL